MASSLFLLVVFLAFSSIMITEAKEFVVGGKPNSWKIPSSSSADSLNQWAESNRFQVGDYLVWNYDAEKDSVLQVTKTDYLTCNITSPIAEHKDGDTKLRLRRSGAHYFISGVEGACVKGEKLLVVVLSENHRVGFRGSASPTPAPAEFDGSSSAIAPATGGASTAGRGLLGAVLGLVIGGSVVGLLVA
ncbi:early nodulin-like protein 3 [Phalaenopsis equestris]|uniref:early nodulin-like protein 3 n=1 Tax=Phalaenopsis equestris TaxID=78828 RepID=UPI0009E4EBCF|nr:early nodulin-like protein 3 [Phalaenopsis equestris]